MLAPFSHLTIIPNIHPALVHFTVALLSISFIFQTIYFVCKSRYPQNKLVKELEVVGRWCLWLTCFFSILTVLAGLHAYYTVPHDEDGHLAMGVHKNSAIITFSLITITSILSIIQFKNKRDTGFLLVGLLAMTQLSVLATAFLGAEVVFRYGVGVIKAQTPEMMTGHNHHGHNSGGEHGEHNHDADSSDQHGNDADHSPTNNSQSTTKTPLYWIDPMEPKVHYPKGGTSPMGMELEPVYPKDGNDNLPNNAIKLPDSYVSNLGVKTTLVQSGAGDSSFAAYGNVESNETKVAFITSYANGWVRNLVANTAQMPIKKGQLLAQIFSPTIVNAENEYQSALISKNDAIISAARNKLLALHVDPIQINEITATSQINQLINIYAPQNGILTSLNIRNGDYITPDKQLFTITDLSSVWMIANIFENQTNQVKIGMPVKVTMNGVLGRSWSGKVEYIYPQLDDATRTARVRIVLNNSDLALKPGMYGNVTFNNGNKVSALLIPTQAIIMSPNENRVVVALGNGVFQVRKVSLGNEVGDMTQVVSGLSSGEQVVSNGEFMLDSEASLSAGVSRIDSSESQVTSTAQLKEDSTMAGMDMSSSIHEHTH